MKRTCLGVGAALALSIVSAGPVWAATLTAADITNPSTQFFDPENNAIYEVVNSQVTQTEAFNSSAAATLDGVHGFLATPLDVQQNTFLYQLAVAHVTTGWDYDSIWLGGINTDPSGNYVWAVGPDAGTVFWTGLANGHGTAGVYENMYAPYLQDVNLACGISGCWSDPIGTGPNALFMYAGNYTPAYWGDAYSSTTAVSTPSSPIAGNAGVRNAYIVEFLGSPSAAPEPNTWALMLLGIGGIGVAIRRSKRRSLVEAAAA